MDFEKFLAYHDRGRCMFCYYGSKALNTHLVALVTRKSRYFVWYSVHSIDLYNEDEEREKSFSEYNCSFSTNYSTILTRVVTSTRA